MCNNGMEALEAPRVPTKRTGLISDVGFGGVFWRFTPATVDTSRQIQDIRRDTN